MAMEAKILNEIFRDKIQHRIKHDTAEFKLVKSAIHYMNELTEKNHKAISICL